MANYQALAAVSATLRNLLQDRMEQSALVTIAPPDVEVTGMGGNRVNLYLYHLQENAQLRNQDLPGRGHPGAYGTPPLSLDLHYLVTAFAATEAAPDADLQAQEIPGDAMRVFHDTPVITEDLHEDDDPARPRILDPALLGEFEQLSVRLEPREADDLSGLWSGLPEASFRRSVSYHCSVVQIESQRPRRAARPVRERRVYAFPFRSPRIDEIHREPPFPSFPVRNAVAGSGDTIVLLGRNLRGASTRVVIGTEVVAIPDAQARRISLVVPTTLPAGLHSVHVVHDLLLDAAEGDPPVPHRGFASNALPLLVIPRITGIAPASVSAGDSVTVTVDPLVGAQQARVLLLDDIALPAEPPAPDSPPSATVDFTIPEGSGAPVPGTYLVRIRVAGAESLLEVDPTTQQYSAPTLAVV
jgi:hypothetical protein